MFNTNQNLAQMKRETLILGNYEPVNTGVSNAFAYKSFLSVFNTISLLVAPSIIIN